MANYTVSQKVSHLMFNFGKCGPITFFHQLIRKKSPYVYTIKISTSPAIR